MARFVASLITTALVGLFTVPVLAQNLDPSYFHSRFEAVRNQDGTVRMLALGRADTQFHLRPIIEEIIRDFKFAKAQRLSQSPNFEAAMTEMHGSNQWVNEWSGLQKRMAKESFAALEGLDIEGILNDSRVQNVLRRFEGKLKDHLMGDRVMAHLQDPAYFYTRAVALQLATWGFNLARRLLPAGPLLDVANTVIDLAVTNVDARRRFHQNMLLFYFERFSPADLKLTEADVSHARSSIYESLIPWWGYAESKNARAIWASYGDDLFLDAWRRAGSTLGSNASRYSHIGDAICFSFREVIEKNERKIVNLVDKKFLFSSQPSNSYYYDDIKKVERQRRLLRLAQVGIQFVSLPNWLSGPFNSFIESMYVSQEKTEGALFGYLKAAGLDEEAATIVHQTINPYLRSDFGLRTARKIWAE